MTTQTPPDNPYGYGPPPQQPRKKRHIGRWVLAAVGAFVVAFVIASVASAGSHPGHPNTTAASTTKASSTPSAAPASTTAPAPSPSPAGNITFTPCDVSLSNSLYGQNYLIAQATEHNTGNIGVVVRVKVSWPLEGFAPITKTKTVRVKPGASKTAEFRYPASESQISDFQNVQLGSNAMNVCKYHGTITGTFGSVSG